MNSAKIFADCDLQIALLPILFPEAGHGDRLRRQSRRFSMLVLSRRAGQSIRIGDDITVHIVRTGSDKVRIGIDAPRSVNVVRTELVDGSVDCVLVAAEADMVAAD
jgi:carbon storage regulator